MTVQDTAIEWPKVSNQHGGSLLTSRSQQQKS